MTDTAPLEQAAERLFDCYETGLTCDPIRDLIPEGDIDAAYAIQNINTERWLAQGRRLVGRKIGLTSVAVQQQLGVDQPDFGMLFSDMAVCDGDPISAQAVHQPKAEAEVAFVLGRDLDQDQPTTAEVLRAIDFAVAAIEVVGSRIDSWNIRLPDTVADNASSGLYVLSNTPVSLRSLDLRNCKMQMRNGDQVISTGIGHACLGHPINAALWLARVMTRVGRPLRAGDVVLSGALGPMVAAKPGDIFEAQVDGLGSVRAAFAME